MNRLEKIELAIKKGITCNPETGEVFGVKGNVITRCSNGYIDINLTTTTLKAHQFIWYWVNKQVVDEIDHIDNDKTNNKIENLRSVTHTQNMWNRSDEGIHFNKTNNKFRALISLNKNRKHLGYFDTEFEAREAYQNAKKQYHKI
jgi:hypothetical protein